MGKEACCSSACFSAGFVLDGLEEPVFDDAEESARPLSWTNYKEIPPVLVARLRLAQGQVR